MPRIICPRCNKITSVMAHIGDYVCDCSQSEASEVLKNDDVLVLGTYDDFGGSGGDTNFSRGAENKLQGTRAGAEGQVSHDLTSRGNIKTLYRSRKHLQYIEVKKDG